MVIAWNFDNNFMLRTLVSVSATVAVVAVAIIVSVAVEVVGEEDGQNATEAE